VLAGEGTQEPHTPSPSRSVEKALDLREVEQPEPVRFLERLLEPARRHGLRYVEERPRDAGHRYPVDHGAIFRVEAAGQVQPDSSLPAAASPGRSDIDP
jgi:hypothetical protein